MYAAIDDPLASFKNTITVDSYFKQVLKTAILPFCI